MPVEFIVQKEGAGLTAYLLNKARKKLPDLKIGKATVVEGKLPRSGNTIHSQYERGVVLKSRDGIDLGKFWNQVSDEVVDLKKKGRNIYHLRWLIKS